MKRNIYTEKNIDRLPHREDTNPYWMYFCSDKYLQERINKWNLFPSSTRDGQYIILKCSENTATCNYGEIYNRFFVENIAQADLNGKKYVIGEFRSVFCGLSSIDDGDFYISFKNLDNDKLDYIAQEVINYIDSLPFNIFDWNEFEEFAKELGGIRD